MTIGEVAARIGLQTSAIRFYEKAGLLMPTARHGGRRIYDSNVLHRLSIIRFAKDLGFSLDEIALLLKDFPANTKASRRWNQLANAKISEMKDLIAKATAVQQMLEKILRCDCPKLEDCARDLADTRSRLAQASPRLRLAQFSPQSGRRTRR